MENLAEVDCPITLNSCYLTHDEYIFELHHFFWDIDKFVIRGWLRPDAWHGAYNIMRPFKIWDPVTDQTIDAIPDDRQLQRNFCFGEEGLAEVRVVTHWLRGTSARLDEALTLTYAVIDQNED